MKIAYALLVHRDAPQVARLIDRLQGSGAGFFVHIDRKADAASFAQLAHLPNTRIVETQVDVKWGGYSIVEASLLLLKTVLQEAIQFDQIVLLSGQDYPIKSNQQILQFFRAQRGKSFFYNEPLGSSWWKGAYARFQQFHPTEWGFKGKDKLAAFINLFLPKRKLPVPGTLYGGPGSGWWSITPAHARFLLDFVKANDTLETFARTTWAPDEFLVQTILSNSEHRQQIVQKSLWFMHWKQELASPSNLTLQHRDDVRRSDALFARKFTAADSAALMDWIDGQLLG